MRDRRKAIYLRCICGIRKAQIQDRRICFLTLTTNKANAEKLSVEDRMYAVARDWNVFRTYLQQPREKGGLGLKFDFFQITTNEGYGVMHVLLIGFPFISFRKLSWLWNQIHGMGFIWISKFRGSPEEMSNYLMSQYLANQRCIFRFKMSNNFICKGFTKHWKNIKNSARDWNAEPMKKIINGYEITMYPIIYDKLKKNFTNWIKFYIKTDWALPYIPNEKDLEYVYQKVII
ncbi:MAG: hypothetical protein H7836_16855 [Magnetococcus sp. YQC-3]